MGLVKELVVLGVICGLVKPVPGCSKGFSRKSGKCEDTDECRDSQTYCGSSALCFNTNGSYYCQCSSGYRHTTGLHEFTGLIEGQCQDINECSETQPCVSNSSCFNTFGSYYCQCSSGFRNSGGRVNFTADEGRCEELRCESFSDDSGAAQALRGLADMLALMKSSCLALANSSVAEGTRDDGEALLEKLFTAADSALSPRPLNDSRHVGALLSAMEKSIMFIGPELRDDRSRIETSETEAEIAVQRGKTKPTGPIHLTNENAAVDTDWATASGTGPYSGFALAALLSYKNLEMSADASFDELMDHNETEEDLNPTFRVFSKVVSVVVSNPSTQQLERPVNITLRHIENREESREVSYICAYWNERGAWSTDGCYQRYSNASHTVCSCEHLSSFAVLMALHPMEHTLGLLLATRIGLVLSLLCLTVSILTFMFCRSIKGTRTTIHLHLCICLFMADLIFLAGISQTEPKGGCSFVAAMLHFFFLGVFTWMLLEGVQLYRMVVLVFNATIRPLYLYLTGYGTPLVIVVLSAIAKPSGYGTDRHCWLSLDAGFIWSFLGPVCLIIFINVFFFIITVWKLAQKFTSLNPDLSTLHKIKAFTVTAIAQMCVLGLMWVFGTFLFQKGNVVASYIFTILNSLQGALVFIMHCLLSKQVRDEYARVCSCICKTEKKYTDLSSSNPSSSSQSQGSRGGQNTGNSQI